MVPSEEVRPWRANSALAEASPSIRGRKPRSKRTARRRRASGNVGDVGNRRGGKMIPITGGTRRGRGPRGPSDTRITGASTDDRTSGIHADRKRQPG